MDLSLSEMQLHPVDWIFIVGYILVAFGIGIYFSRRASKNITEYFIAGRTLSWWVAGTSIVATTFAADTPLVVSGLIRSGGIYENWLWWNVMMGGVLMVFFYAHLWHRAGILTDNEFVELRYGGHAAGILRGFGAVYGGVVINCITMGWVMLAMVKICDVMLGWDKLTAITVLVIAALIYTILSGFWGVVMTDLIQFLMAMTGSISLAGIVLWHMGGPAGMVEQIQATENFDPNVFRFMPELSWDSGSFWYTGANLALITFTIQIALQWWGGGQGGGYVAQRLFATKNEKHAVLAALWYNFAHFVIRPWPWLIVGLASLVFFPDLPDGDAELAYPLMIAEFLPVGLRGLMVASLLAAFMSTVDTQLNWGSSYLINDLYKRFMVKEASPRHYVTASRISMLLIMACGAFAAWQADNIANLWKYLMTLGAGGGFLGLLRWYWWRPNVWSEVSALLGSFIIANGNIILRPLGWVGVIPAEAMADIEWFYGGDLYAVRLVFIIAIVTAIWIGVTYLTRPTNEERLVRFYRRVRPGGWWGPIARECPDIQPAPARRGWLGWFASCVCIYCGLFGVGYLCLGQYLQGLLMLALGFAAGWLALTQISAIGASDEATPLDDEGYPA